MRACGGRDTYFMGAYTFSAHPPFKVLAVSPYPIVEDIFYSGRWFKSKRRPVDYVVYPSSIYMDKNETLILTVGLNDLEGYLVRVDVHELMATLVRISDE